MHVRPAPHWFYGFWRPFPWLCRPSCQPVIRVQTSPSSAAPGTPAAPSSFPEYLEGSLHIVDFSESPQALLRVWSPGRKMGDQKGEVAFHSPRLQRARGYATADPLDREICGTTEGEIFGAPTLIAIPAADIWVRSVCMRLLTPATVPSIIPGAKQQSTLAECETNSHHAL